MTRDLRADPGCRQVDQVQSPEPRDEQDQPGNNQHPADPDITALGRAIGGLGHLAFAGHRRDKMPDQPADRRVKGRDEQQDDHGQDRVGHRLPQALRRQRFDNDPGRTDQDQRERGIDPRDQAL